MLRMKPSRSRGSARAKHDSSWIRNLLTAAPAVTLAAQSAGGPLVGRPLGVLLPERRAKGRRLSVRISAVLCCTLVLRRVSCAPCRDVPAGAKDVRCACGVEK